MKALMYRLRARQWETNQVNTDVEFSTAGEESGPGRRTR